MDLDNPTSLITTSTIHGLCGRLHSTLWLYLVVISWSWCLQYPGCSTTTEAVHSPLASWTLPGVSKPATWCQTSGDSSMTPSILGVSGTSEATPLVAAPSFSPLLFITASLWFPRSQNQFTFGGFLHVTKFGCQAEMQPWRVLDHSFYMTLEDITPRFHLKPCWSPLSHIRHSGFFSSSPPETTDP